MHDSVRKAWRAFTEPFEGFVSSMYLDVRALVTTGCGNLIDPVSEALKLPFLRDSDNQLATQAEISAAWHALKARPDLAKRHVRHARALTGLHLADADIDALVDRKLLENDRYIAGWFPDWENVPADAQLAVHSMAWAAGPGFNRKFPAFTKAALAGDWMGARAECELRPVSPEGIPNPGVIPRNRANQLCFANAAVVVACGIQRQILHWPDVREPTVPVTDTSADELRAIAMAAKADADFLRSTEWRSAAHREMSGLDPDTIDDPDDDARA
jgi:hypothetical protein